MKIVEIRYDAAPLLSQTVGPFLTEASAEDWKRDLMKALADWGWQEIPNVTTTFRRPGEGFISRLRELETGHMMTVQMKPFDEPKIVDLFTNDVNNAIRSLPLRRK
ncbi:MAG TPA: hypothetical protein VL500_04110 [Candidatus Eisenbacteria bacterium]|nr:hypothetical protein [Candidatus Eisenbacteria bacterium]